MLLTPVKPAGSDGLYGCSPVEEANIVLAGADADDVADASAADAGAGADANAGGADAGAVDNSNDDDASLLVARVSLWRFMQRVVRFAPSRSSRQQPAAS